MRKIKLTKQLNNHPQKENLIKLIKGFQQLEQSGMTKQEINEQIQALRLPLGIHLFFTAHYSDLISLNFK